MPTPAPTPTPTPTPTAAPIPTPTQTPIPTTTPTPTISSCVIYEDFNDLDFTANPTWHQDILQGCAPAPGIVEVDNGELHIKQSGAGGCGNNAGIHMDLDIPIAGKQATVSFDVKSIYSTVRGGSGDNGWNYPAMVVLDLQDINGQQKGLWIGYSYRGGYSGVAPADANIYILGHGDVPQDTWLRGQRIVIQDYWPTASRITGISIRGDGWDYESRFDNVCLKVEPISTAQTEETSGKQRFPMYIIGAAVGGLIVVGTFSGYLWRRRQETRLLTRQKEKLEKWEREGYDVSKFRKRWFR
jgi:hypothetical protein